MTTTDTGADGQYVSAGASISACGNYRYRLWREWRLHPLPAHWDMWTEDDGKPVLDGAGAQLGEPLSCVFVMLNPSTADATEDDPTIRRCIGFAKALGYDRLEVVNLFAWRATEPRVVLGMGGRNTPDPVGIENQKHVADAIYRAGIVVCAWGVPGCHLGQDETMLGWIDDAIEVVANQGRNISTVALKLTKERFPAHPLYLPQHLKPFPYSGRATQDTPR